MTDKEQIMNNFAKDINVPSKEQTNDSLKNQDKNFNENFTQEKEQIIIDGCNVLKCRYYQYKTLKDCEMRYPESGDCETGLLNYLFNGNLDMEKLCVDNPNCYFKQLKHKEQECEKYELAFEEIKKVLSHCVMTGAIVKILYIINKAKGGSNAR